MPLRDEGSDYDRASEDGGGGAGGAGGEVNKTDL